MYFLRNRPLGVNVSVNVSVNISVNVSVNVSVNGCERSVVTVCWMTVIKQVGRGGSDVTPPGVRQL